MAQESQAPRRLEEVLGHRFRRAELLEEALTHASSAAGHNERLEHLGDAVLNLVAAEMLFLRHPDAREGLLTQWKSLLVARETLARVGERLGLAPYLRVGGGLDGEALPRSLLGNAVESLLGAVYLDAGGGLDPRGGGLAACAQLAARWLEPELAALPDRHARAHAKMLLQDWAQAQGGPPPIYVVTDAHEHPDAHAFRVCAECAGRRFAGAWASTKREAERLAAWEAVLTLRAEGARIGGDGRDAA
jgi:ribonuclease-3